MLATNETDLYSVFGTNHSGSTQNLTTFPVPTDPTPAPESTWTSGQVAAVSVLGVAVAVLCSIVAVLVCRRKGKTRNTFTSESSSGTAITLNAYSPDVPPQDAVPMVTLTKDHARKRATYEVIRDSDVRPLHGNPSAISPSDDQAPLTEPIETLSPRRKASTMPGTGTLRDLAQRARAARNQDYCLAKRVDSGHFTLETGGEVLNSRESQV